MLNRFLSKRIMFCAKLYVLAFVAIASSTTITHFDSLPTHRHSPSRDGKPPYLDPSTFKRYGRKPAAVPPVPDGNDLDLDNIDLDKEEKEDEALFKKTKDIFDGKKLADVDDDAADDDEAKDVTFRDLGREAKDLGLSEEDLKELDDIEKGKVAVSRIDSLVKQDPDERPRDVPPPPGMVANPHEMKKVTKDVQVDDGLKLDKPPAPKEPAKIKVDPPNSTDTSTASSAEKNSDYEERIATLSKSLETARQELSDANNKASAAKNKAAELKVQYDRAKEQFKHSLETAKSEEKSEKEEMASTIKEQKRAFDELFEEKQLLSQMLSDEQKTLKELQEKIQHPDLGLWVRQRAEKAAILVETPETDAVKYYAKKYMAPKVTKMRHRLELLEKRVERTVDHLLPAKYGGIVALFLTLGLVGFPIMVTMSTVVTLTKSVSLRQYVLLGNVFLTAFAAGLCIAGVLLQQDPLQTLYEASETLFITLQLTIAVLFPVFLGIIGLTVLKSRDRLDAFVFGCEFVFYSLVAMNYRSRVWRPAMLGQNIETSIMMYSIYLMDFMSMTALTISSSRIDNGIRRRDADPEIGSEVKAGGMSGSGLLNGSVSSKVSSLSSGLIHAAIGQTRSGKEE